MPLKDQEVRGKFLDANRKAANALSDYATWLRRETAESQREFASGRATISTMANETELVDFRPRKFSRSGCKLKEEQQVFANAAKIIDPKKHRLKFSNKSRSEHPTPEKLIPDMAKNLDQIRHT